MKKKMFTILNRKTKFTIKLHMFKLERGYIVRKQSKKSKKKERETDDS